MITLILVTVSEIDALSRHPSNDTITLPQPLTSHCLYDNESNSLQNWEKSYERQRGSVMASWWRQPLTVWVRYTTHGLLTATPQYNLQVIEALRLRPRHQNLSCNRSRRCTTGEFSWPSGGGKEANIVLTKRSAERDEKYDVQRTHNITLLPASGRLTKWMV